MSKFLNCVLFGALVGLAMPAHGAEPLRLAPSSKWTVGVGDQTCRLARVFGTGEDKTVLFIQRFDPGDSFRLAVGGKLFRKLAYQSKAQFQFGPDEEAQESGFRAGNVGAYAPALIFDEVAITARDSTARIDAISAQADPRYVVDPKREAAVTWLSIGRPGREPIVLETGPMDKPFADLRACSDELLTDWGVDPAAHARLTRWAQPLGNPGEWLGADDYPPEMLGGWQEGLMRFVLLVDARGKATDCRAQEWNRPKELVAPICAALQSRARFEPALDAEGKPVASYWRSAVRFDHAWR